MMLDARCVLVTAVIALGGCGGRSEKTCSSSAEELERFLTAMDHDASVIWPDDLRLVMRADLPRLELPRAPIVSLRPTAVVFNGNLVDRAELTAQLTLERTRFAEAVSAGLLPEHGAPDPGDIHLVIDQAAAWETVVWVVETLHGVGYDAPYFAFGRPPATPPPPRTWVDDELDQARKTADLSERMVAVPGIGEKVMQSCSALVDAFGNAATRADNKVEFIIHAIRPALVDCNCNVDLAALRSALWRLLGNPDPTTGIRIAFARDAKPIALPAATPWREANQHLGSATKSTWFAIRE